MKNKLIFALAAVLIMLAVGIWVLVFFSLKWQKDLIPSLPDVFETVTTVIVGDGEVTKFTSEQDFKDYLADVRSTYADGVGGFGFGGDFRAVDEMVVDAIDLSDVALGEASGLGSTEISVDRVSETNVQTVGIDEPDIVKTDGQEIYYAQEDQYYYWQDYGDDQVTALISALPVDEMDIDSEILMSGDLLLADDVLMILSYGEVIAYDVSDPTEPVETWSLEYDDATYQDARLYNGQLYLLSYTWINEYEPCPIEPYTLAGEVVEISCRDVYHPVTPVPTDVTYNIMSIDPATGDIEDQLAITGAYSDSTLYMSAENIYLTNSYPESFVSIVVDFFDQEAYNLVSSEVLQKIRNLNAYEISDQAKMVEFQVILEEYLASLDDDERLEFENEFENRMTNYQEERKRELTTTQITKIDLKDLSIEATGEVPGSPLNQWSLDEYDDYLRIGVTIGGSGFWGWMFGSGAESVNDLYVLNDNLNIVGKVLDLGEGERIYSTRFIGEEGYMVTFRETDPFYVFDLSNPRKPEAVGELKIPGYSSYLHPLTQDLILGVGREDSNVKLSLFDVTDPSDPQEVSKYTLDESWSDALETHHAFLQDSKFGVFFMPGGRGGYVFSYADNEISLEKAVANVVAKRALYINDYLYVIGEDEIVVLDESTWERAGELNL